MSDSITSQNEINNDRNRGIAGSTLKLVAIITMAIDHIGASVIARMLSKAGKSALTTSNPTYLLYEILRGIGRLAFPIFIFLLIEGYVHMRNKWKYLGRMGIFALVSEIPFDIAVFIKPEVVREYKLLELAHQNVYFTLFIGLLTVVALDEIEKTFAGTAYYMLLNAAAIITGSVVAYLLKTDYSMAGVIAISEMYIFRRNKMLGFTLSVAVLALISSTSELLALFGLPLIYFYNGKRGLKLKYVFYLFYPVHLLILAMIRIFFVG